MGTTVLPDNSRTIFVEDTRRSLQEANRLALERTRAQFLGLPEVKTLGVGRKDLQDYARGLIELAEGPSRSTVRDRPSPYGPKPKPK